MEKKTVKKEGKEIKGSRPSFFKIIPPFPQTPEQLQIPSEFTKYISKDMTEQAALRGPSGRCWPVKIYKNAKGMFIREGWNQFREAHSLGHFEFLVFNFDRKRFFDVSIFGSNGVERVYDCQHDPSYMEEKNERVEAFKKRGRPRNYYVGSEQIKEEYLKKCVEKVPSMGEVEEIIWVSDEETGKLNNLKSCQSKLLNCHIDCPSSNKKPPSTQLRRDALFMENGKFCSRFPFFQKHIQPHNITRKEAFWLPTFFAATYLPRTKSRMTLRNEDGDSWEVTYCPREKYGHTFTAGWASFAQHNKLKLHDLCIFVLVMEMEMQVYIIRAM